MLFLPSVSVNVLFMVHPFPFKGATALRNAAQFGPGTGRIWLSNVQCTVDDPALANCTFGNQIGINNCNHNQDAGVICFTGSGM